MAPDLREQLQGTLGGAYTIEQELGGGGMSRVFLAEDRSLERKIVLKVLPPELGSGVNTARFRKEIQLAARLQHPHIVPLLSAGDAGGLTYFTMPFVDGESLRQRLARVGALPISEGVKILREVADALAYAHKHGLVHRDIKPDNVLCADGHVMVTDFGVAKALQSSSGMGGVTSAGVALGTPAYMAPEQAIADPSTDHRADIYALGVLGYELLTGTTPFGARSVQQLLAAQVTEKPEPPSRRRPSIPPALDELIMRCLEKQAADRPQSAEEVGHVLDAIATPSSGTTLLSPLSRPAEATATPFPRLGGSALALAAAGIVVLLGSAGFVWWRERQPPVLDPKRVVVAPFENLTGETSLDPVGRMTADWLTRAFAQTGMIDVRDARAALDPRPGTKAVSIVGGPAGIRALADATGARTVVTGSYSRSSDSLEFVAKLIDASSGQILRALEGVRSPINQPLQGIETFRKRLTGALASLLDPRLASYASVNQSVPTFDAYREFVDGVDAYSRIEMKVAASHFQKAVALDSAFLPAKLWLADTYSNLAFGWDSVPAAFVLYDALSARRERLSTLDALVLDLRLAAWRKDYEEALRLARKAAELWPDRWSYNAALFASYRNKPREAIRIVEGIDPHQGFMRGWISYWEVYARALHQAGEYDRQLEVARQATKELPGEPLILGVEMEALAGIGRTAEIDRRMNEVLTVSPRTYRSGVLNAGSTLRAMALIALAHGHKELGTRLAQRGLGWLRSQPSSAATSEALAELSLVVGELDGARKACDAMARSQPHAAADSIADVACLARIAARRGDRAETERAIGELAAFDLSKVRPGERLEKEIDLLVTRAALAATLGDQDRAVTLLEESFRKGMPYDSRIEHNPAFIPLHGHARYEELMRPTG